MRSVIGPHQSGAPGTTPAPSPPDHRAPIAFPSQRRRRRRARWVHGPEDEIRGNGWSAVEFGEERICAGADARSRKNAACLLDQGRIAPTSATASGDTPDAASASSPLRWRRNISASLLPVLAWMARSAPVSSEQVPGRRPVRPTAAACAVPPAVRGQLRCRDSRGVVRRARGLATCRRAGPAREGAPVPGGFV